jgi:DNA-binding IclR family transcriptional regulator
VTGTSGEAGTRGAERVADVMLMFLSNSATLGVSDIARSLGLSKAVVHRILQSLASRGLVEPSAQDQRYRAGPSIAETGLGSALYYDETWHHAANLVLGDLRSQSGETATLSARVGALRMFVDQVEGAGAVRLSVALWQPRPLYVGASGKAILAFVEPQLLHQLIEHRLTYDGHRPPPGGDELEDELAQIRDTGVALSRAEVNPDAFACAAPIFRKSRAVGAISILGSVRRQSDMTRFASVVRAAGEQLSEIAPP